MLFLWEHLLKLKHNQLIWSNYFLPFFLTFCATESCRDYYTTLDFIHRRCREMNGAVARAFLTGARRLPAEMGIAIDSQSLMVNWPRKVQRRTVEMTSCCNVDSASFPCRWPRVAMPPAKHLHVSALVASENGTIIRAPRVTKNVILAVLIVYA